MKGVFVVIDGVSDEMHNTLDGKTPLEHARTPHLDALAGKSFIHKCVVVGEGIAPESSNGILSLLGYESSSVARGPLEALGAGVRFSRGDLVLRTNFATIDEISSMELLDRRAGRTLSEHEARTLANAINKQVKLPYKFEFVSTLHHRGVLVFRGGFSDNISNVDPEYGVGGISQNMKVHFSHSLDEDEESKLAADLVNRFVRRSHEILDVHPLNKIRAKKGLYSANFILCRDAGNEVPRLAKLKGSWRALSYMPLETGIAKAAKMDVSTFAYPPLKGIDVYSNLYAGLGKAISNAVEMIKKYHKDYDYFFVHFKETDVPGHDNKPIDKVKMIEMIDSGFFGFVNKILANSEFRVVVTADHTTSCRQKMHTDKPVPLLFYAPARIQSHKLRFDESCCENSKALLGRKVLEKTLLS